MLALIILISTALLSLVLCVIMYFGWRRMNILESELKKSVHEVGTLRHLLSSAQVRPPVQIQQANSQIERNLKNINSNWNELMNQNNLNYNNLEDTEDVEDAQETEEGSDVEEEGSDVEGDEEDGEGDEEDDEEEEDEEDDEEDGEEDEEEDEDEEEEDEEEDEDEEEEDDEENEEEDEDDNEDDNEGEDNEDDHEEDREDDREEDRQDDREDDREDDRQDDRDEEKDQNRDEGGDEEKTVLSDTVIQDVDMGDLGLILVDNKKKVKTSKVPNEPASMFEEGYVNISENDGRPYIVKLDSHKSKKWYLMKN